MFDIDKQRTFLIILTIFFMGLVLTLFYFTYAKKVEQQVVMRQMKLLVNDLVSDADISLSKPIANDIRKIIASVPIPNSLLQSDVVVAKENETIEKNTFIFFGVAASVVLLMTIIYTFFNKSNDLKLSVLFVDLFFILIAVALTEFVFLRFFASKYYPTDVNFVKYTFLNNF